MGDNIKPADFAARLKQGGGRRNLIKGQTLYERKPNPDAKRSSGSRHKIERLTYLDRSNEARYLMSAQLKMPDGLRSVGNLYGASVQIASVGLGNTFAQEAVDGGKHGATGGAVIRMVEALEVARIAWGRLTGMDPITYAAKANKCRQGAHHPITPRELVDAICVEGLDMVEVAFRAGWWTERHGKTVLAKRQGVALKQALIEALKEIDDAWAKEGIDARGILGVVEVR